MSSCELLIVGRNRLLYLEKLKRHGIKVYATKVIDEKRIILRINAKDADKAIELAGDTWYNKVVKYSGLYRFAALLKRNFLIIFSSLLFIAAITVLNNFILEIDYSDVPVRHKAAVEQILKSEDISPLSAFSDIKEDSLKVKAAKYGFTFFEVKREGFRLKVSVRSNDDKYSVIERRDKIVAPYNCRIVSIVVFSGRALKKAGDEVYFGEPIVEGIASINDREYSVNAIAQIVVEQTVTEEFGTDSTDKKIIDDCIAAARLQVFGEECKSSVSITPVGESYIIRVELSVLRIINGG